MRTIVTLLLGIMLCATSAGAAGDIPTRYAGAFPSDGTRMKITGTFTGKALNLKFVVEAKAGRDPTRSGQYACTQASPNTTRCTGTFRSGDGRYTGSQNVVVTWNAGRPAAMSFSH